MAGAEGLNDWPSERPPRIGPAVCANGRGSRGGTRATGRCVSQRLSGVEFLGHGLVEHEVWDGISLGGIDGGV